MPTGPKEIITEKLAQCFCDTLEKDAAYTISQASQTCGADYRTVMDYLTLPSHKKALRKAMERLCSPKTVQPKDACGCYPGLVVDPPPEEYTLTLKDIEEMVGVSDYCDAMMAELDEIDLWPD